MLRFFKSIYHRLPLHPGRKLAFKDFVYANFGRAFASSFGYRAWLATRPAELSKQRATRPSAPDPEAFRLLVSGRRTEPAKAKLAARPYVVVPVHGGVDETLSCLYHVLAADDETDVVVVDDASPEPTLVRRLGELTSAGLIELIRNPVNLGFVKSVGIGMKQHPDRDVILLNSDTQVFGDWVSRLHHCASSSASWGTVTPLSNNAEIASYPRVLANNDEEMDFGRLDWLAATGNRGRVIELPTAVGFCMYIKRACLDAVGPFDEGYGRGYGEENDFCMRATQCGWRHALAGDVFVRHIGGVSFGAEAPALKERAQKRLGKRFPSYQGLIHSFVRQDPARPVRAALDLARLMDAVPSSEATQTVLFVTHAHEGGVGRHVADLASRLEHEGVRVLVMKPAGESSRGRVGISRLGAAPAPNLQGLDVQHDEVLLLDLLRRARIDLVHIHNLDGFGSRAPAWVKSFCEKLACAYDITAHDHQAICPRKNLIGVDGDYCGEPAPAECDRCLSKGGSSFGRPTIDDWRREWKGLLGGARRIYCPSRDVLQRIVGLAPGAGVVYHPHPESAPRRFERRSAHRKLDRVRVAIIGAIGPEKGAGVLLACAQDAATRNLPIDFVVIGYSDRDADLLRTKHVEITGRYRDDELAERIEAADCHLCFVPSICPESYCYTLSAALGAGLVAASFDLGAQAERITATGRGRVLSYELRSRPGALNDQLLALASDRQDGTACEIWEPPAYPSIVEDYYGTFAS